MNPLSSTLTRYCRKCSSNFLDLRMRSLNWRRIFFFFYVLWIMICVYVVLSNKALIKLSHPDACSVRGREISVNAKSIAFWDLFQSSIYDSWPYCITWRTNILWQMINGYENVKKYSSSYVYRVIAAWVTFEHLCRIWIVIIDTLGYMLTIKISYVDMAAVSRFSRHWFTVHCSQQFPMFIISPFPAFLAYLFLFQIPSN